MARYTIGLMSGTSLDGADGALVEWPSCKVLGFASQQFPDKLRDELLDLCSPGNNEIDRMGQAGLELAQIYATVVKELLVATNLVASDLSAIGCHGQTIRHRPADGYTVQLQNPALLAELTGITVISDFRSRDMAAGGQGAPLAPAFHEAVFGKTDARCAVVNIGGISNATLLDGNTCITGFDCGPGNALMDHWVQKHLGTRYDAHGAWAASAKADASLLQRMLAEPYFTQAPPKSTGRELFNSDWLESKLKGCGVSPAGVQATLLELTARSIHAALAEFGKLEKVLVCGGGALNARLMQRLGELLNCPVEPTDSAGIPSTQVEAVAFAWLADCALQGKRHTLSHITGSRHPVPLGAIYPA